MGRYYTVSGKSTQIDGVKSDIVVPTAYNKREIGEALLDYPLPSDSIQASYDDLLVDLDWDSKRWYAKYYTPSLQEKVGIWRAMLPYLQENSKYRLDSNGDYQLFLGDLEEGSEGLYADGEDEVIDQQHIVNEFALIRNKYLGLVKALDAKQFQINNIVKLRAAGLEDVAL